MSLNSCLISGAGNTFHVMNWYDLPVDQRDEKKLSKITFEICQKYSADGAIFLDYSKDPRVKWYFYNNDGSKAEMCGNATRCVGFYLNEKAQSNHQEWQLETIAGLIQITRVAKNDFKVVMTAVQKLKSDLGFLCNTGVPHLVLPIDNFDQHPNLKKQSSELRHHPSVQPSGTNVTYVGETENLNTIRAVSFERGVEDFTQACGTGAVAAALYWKEKHPDLNEIYVQMPGGKLKINLTDLQKPIMEGPAVLLQEIQYV